MAQTQEFMVSCGTGKVAAHLPIERTRIPPGPPPSATPLPDAAEAFRRALANPVGMPPLEKLVKKGARVTIGIQDGPDIGCPVAGNASRLPATRTVPQALRTWDSRL